MKQTILFLCLLFVGCQKQNLNDLLSPEFVVKKVQPFNGQWLHTAYNGKRLLLDERVPKGDTIYLFNN